MARTKQTARRYTGSIPLMFDGKATYLGMRDGVMLIGMRESKQEPNGLTPQEGQEDQPDRYALVTSDPSLLVQAGNKRRRLMEVAPTSETRNVVQKVEELAELLLTEGDATGHEDHNFQTDCVPTSELETFRTLMSKLKGRLETQQNTLGNVSVPLASRAEDSEGSFRPSSPAYAPTSPQYDPFREWEKEDMV